MTFEAELPTNPGGRPPPEKLLEKTYDFASATHHRLVQLEAKVDEAIRPVAFPRRPLWVAAVSLAVIALGAVSFVAFLVLNHHAVIQVAR